jgi:hypothetical protein
MDIRIGLTEPPVTHSLITVEVIIVLGRIVAEVTIVAVA